MKRQVKFYKYVLLYFFSFSAICAVACKHNECEETINDIRPIVAYNWDLVIKILMFEEKIVDAFLNRKSASFEKEMIDPRWTKEWENLKKYKDAVDELNENFDKLSDLVYKLHQKKLDTHKSGCQDRENSAEIPICNAQVEVLESIRDQLQAQTLQSWENLCLERLDKLNFLEKKKSSLDAELKTIEESRSGEMNASKAGVNQEKPRYDFSRQRSLMIQRGKISQEILRLKNGLLREALFEAQAQTKAQLKFYSSWGKKKYIEEVRQVKMQNFPVSKFRSISVPECLFKEILKGAKNQNITLTKEEIKNLFIKKMNFKEWNEEKDSLKLGKYLLDETISFSESLKKLLENHEDKHAKEVLDKIVSETGINPSTYKMTIKKESKLEENTSLFLMENYFLIQQEAKRVYRFIETLDNLIKSTSLGYSQSRMRWKEAFGARSAILKSLPQKKYGAFYAYASMSSLVLSEEYRNQLINRDFESLKKYGYKKSRGITEVLLDQAEMCLTKELSMAGKYYQSVRWAERLLDHALGVAERMDDKDQTVLSQWFSNLRGEVSEFKEYYQDLFPKDNVQKEKPMTGLRRSETVEFANYQKEGQNVLASSTFNTHQDFSTSDSRAMPKIKIRVPSGKPNQKDTDDWGVFKRIEPSIPLELLEQNVELPEQNWCRESNSEEFEFYKVPREKFHDTFQDGLSEQEALAAALMQSKKEAEKLNSDKKR